MAQKRKIEEVSEDKELSQKAQTVSRIANEISNIVLSYQNLTKFYFRLLREIEKDPTLLPMIKANWEFIGGNKTALPIPANRAEARELLKKFSLGIFLEEEEKKEPERKRPRKDGEGEGDVLMPQATGLS